MSVEAKWVRYGEFSGYLAQPAGVERGLPGAVVIQEIWGVDEHIEDVARRLAMAGYAALAPELFARDGRLPEALARDRVAEAKGFLGRNPLAFRDPAARAEALGRLPGEERDRLEGTLGGLLGSLGRMDGFLPALRAAVRHLREEHAASRGQKTACLGFCMGGGLTGLLACEEPDLAGAAIFYGSAPPADRIPKIGCPVIGFYGGLDERINAGIPAFQEAMRMAGKSFEPHLYEGANHAFFNDTRPAYDVGASRDAWARLLAFLGRTTVPS
jgi:carboxymethylenebutenolidase